MKRTLLLIIVLFTVIWIINFSTSIKGYSQANIQENIGHEKNIAFSFSESEREERKDNNEGLNNDKGENSEGEIDDEQSLLEINQQKIKLKKVTISVAGDFTIGTDLTYGYQDSFIHEVERQNKNYDYFVKHFKSYFEKDDLSLVNLETTFTNATKKAMKKFRFKGDPDLAQILQLASVEAVNIANNHTYDYLEEGFYDTIQALEKYGIEYFGFNYKLLKSIDGVKVGALGYKGWEFTDEITVRLKADLNYLKQYADIIIVSFHWGTQNSYYPDATQTKIAHYAVDQGANLVFGHHPHVIQGIEKYNNSYIVYSLGNFLYGGHRNPADKDTFIFQQSFYYDMQKKQVNNGEMKVIPFSISSVDYRNNYQPTPLEKEEKEEFFEKIKQYSSFFDQEPLQLQ